MAKIFNVSGACEPGRHYMVALKTRLKEIRAMIDAGEYFTINKARQYGKTTILHALTDFLKKDYIVVSMDFQRIGASKFKTENIFSATFARDFIKKAGAGNQLEAEALMPLKKMLEEQESRIELYELFSCLTEICVKAGKPVVLIIDEVDSASNNQVFLDFLAQLRACYLDRDTTPTFWSVILAGVYDIRNIRQKIRSDAEHKMNSPWNIAAKFQVDMSFSAQEIAGMLKEYEEDYHTGMDIEEISQMLYAYTSGYPYLVSCLCKNMDEEVAGTEKFPDKSCAWTQAGFLEAVKLLINDNNTLFQSLTGKLADYPELKSVVYELLFTGRPIPYVPQNQYIDIAAMFGFIKNDKGTAVIANRIFESVLYNLFISEEFAASRMYDAGVQERNQLCGI